MMEVAEPRPRTVDDLPADWPVSRLAQRIRELLPGLRTRYGIRSLAVFGSYVRNEQRPGSDLDLLVSLDGRLGLFEQVELRDDLQEQLGVGVDITMCDRLQPRIGRYILREALEL